MLYLAIGIIGATVMPHNLYLHSGVVQTRRFGESVEDKREAIKLATIDSTIALMFALLINASILILAAATFNKTGQTDVAELGEVHTLIAPLLGSGHGADAVRHRAAVLRAELDGDGDAGGPDRDGRLHRHPPAALGAAADDARDRHRAGRGGDDLVRRGGHGEAADPQPGDPGPALPFAIVPLVMFTADRAKMGELVAPRWVTGLAALIAAILIVLNIKLLYDLDIGEYDRSARIARAYTPASAVHDVDAAP